MYRIKADDILIFDSRLEDYAILEGSVDLEVNTAGSCTFELAQTHPFYDRILKMKTIVKVYKKDDLIFRGRVVSDECDFLNRKTFTCEGELSFFNDSIQRPYAFTGSPTELLTQFVNNHNAQVSEDKRFKIGEITVIDNNDYINRSNSKYESTWKNISDRLLDTLGGYFYITHDENDMPILNWLADFPYMSDQKIEFGENLRDFIKTDSTQEVATALIPLGAKLEEEESEEPETPETQEEPTEPEKFEKRLTIESVNGGLDYIYDEDAVERYGWIFTTETWDDVTEPENLLRKGREYLAEKINRSITIEVDAVDLSLMDIEIDSFKFCEYIKIVSKPHGFDDKMLLTKQSIDLLSPQNDKITLGFTKSTFTDESLDNNNQNGSLNDRVENIESDYVTNDVLESEVQNLTSSINQTASSILLQVSESYVTNDRLTSEVSSQFEVLKDGINVSFEEIEKKIDDTNSTLENEITDRKTYIRFDIDGIEIGKYGELVQLRMSNDTIGFYENNNLIAYFKDRKLYVFDGEFVNSVKIGSFAFVPRENGNTSFMKVVK